MLRTLIALVALTAVAACTAAPTETGSNGAKLYRISAAQESKIQFRMLDSVNATYETETETLSAWMGQPDTRAAIMDERGQDLGFAWYQEPGGKIWWTLIVGGSGANNIQVASPIAARPQG